MSNYYRLRHRTTLQGKLEAFAEDVFDVVEGVPRDIVVNSQELLEDAATADKASSVEFVKAASISVLVCDLALNEDFDRERVEDVVKDVMPEDGEYPGGANHMMARVLLEMNVFADNLVKEYQEQILAECALQNIEQDEDDPLLGQA
jgi:hypothetical protein